jgi:hypothetical protein
MECQVKKPEDLLSIPLNQITGCICSVNGPANEAQVGASLDGFGPVFNMWMEVCKDKFHRFCSRFSIGLFNAIWSASVRARLKLLVQFLLDDGRGASCASTEVDICVLLDGRAQNTVNSASYELGGRGLL